MKKCEWCGKEFKNVVVHQRHCKSKNLNLEKKNQENEIKSEEIIEMIKKDSELKNIPINIELQSEIDLQTSKKIEKSVLESEIINDDKTDNILVKQKKDFLDNKFIENSDLKIKEELVIDFNESRDRWQESLDSLLKGISSGKIIKLRLKAKLSHVFSESFGKFVYPSDVFITILRNNCISFEDIENEFGGQTFICNIR